MPTNHAITPIVLASTSPWRLQMLRQAGVVVEGVAPGVDEASTEPDPASRALELAERKARAVCARRPEALVLAADQVVTDGTAIWGKPRDPADHLARLLAMRGGAHDLITGWVLIGAQVERRGVARTRMWVRGDLTDAELAAYVATGEGSACAGGYAVEGRGAFLFERFDGDWFNILGLPLLDVMSALRDLGWRFSEDA